jgi:hypothetical protein
MWFDLAGLIWLSLVWLSTLTMQHVPVFWLRSRQLQSDPGRGSVGEKTPITCGFDQLTLIS